MVESDTAYGLSQPDNILICISQPLYLNLAAKITWISSHRSKHDYCMWPSYPWNFDFSGIKCMDTILDQPNRASRKWTTPWNPTEGKGYLPVLVRWCSFSPWTSWLIPATPMFWWLPGMCVVYMRSIWFWGISMAERRTEFLAGCTQLFTCVLSGNCRKEKEAKTRAEMILCGYCTLRVAGRLWG